MAGYASERQQRHDAYQRRMPSSMTASPSTVRTADAASAFALHLAGSALNAFTQPFEQNAYVRSSYSTVRPFAAASATTTIMSQIGSSIRSGAFAPLIASMLGDVDFVTDNGAACQEVDDAVRHGQRNDGLDDGPRGSDDAGPRRGGAAAHAQLTRRRRAARRPIRVWAAAAVVAIVLVGGWWLTVRTPSSEAVGGPGTTLAAYRPADLHSLQVSPIDERTVFFGHHRGMLVSQDRGATWTTVAGTAGDAMGVAIPAGSRTEFVAGHDVFFRSDDSGRTWSSLRPALPGTDIHGFAASAVSVSTFYAYVVGSGLFKSSDNGQTWQKAGEASGGTMSMTVARAGGADVLFVNTMNGVERSRDGGRTWEPVREVGAATLNAVGETVYAAAGGAVLVSADGGMTWSRKAFGRGGAALVAAAPTNPKTVYVLTERLEVWRSLDGGTSWERAG